MDEQQLIVQAKRDPHAFTALYDQTYDQIFYFLLKRCGNHELAQDLTSETYFKALRHLHSYEPRPGKPFVAWLYRIASNELNKYVRSQKNYKFVDAESHPEVLHLRSPYPEAPELIHQAELFQALHRACQSLSEDDQLMIGLRFFEEKSVKEIAQIMTIEEGTVKSRLHRVIAKLKQKKELSREIWIREDGADINSPS